MQRTSVQKSEIDKMDGRKTCLFMLFEINRDEERYFPGSVAI